MPVDTLLTAVDGCLIDNAARVDCSGGGGTMRASCLATYSFRWAPVAQVEGEVGNFGAATAGEDEARRDQACSWQWRALAGEGRGARPAGLPPPPLRQHQLKICEATRAPLQRPPLLPLWWRWRLTRLG